MSIYQAKLYLTLHYKMCHAEVKGYVNCAVFMLGVLAIYFDLQWMRY